MLKSYFFVHSLLSPIIPRRELQLAAVAALVAAMSVQGVTNIKEQYQVINMKIWNFSDLTQ